MVLDGVRGGGISIALPAAFHLLGHAAQQHPRRPHARLHAVNGALALTFFRVDGELTGGTAWVRALAIAMFAVYVAAECTSYYNTATTNELYAAIEAALDAASQVLLLPAAVRLAFAVPKARGQRGLRSSSRSSASSP